MKKFNSLLNFDAKPHQLDGLKYALAHHYSINAFKMGHGKTLIGILLSLYTKLPTVIVSPAYLKFNWEKELKKFSKKELKIKVIFSADAGFDPTGYDVVIINYAILKNFKKVFQWGKLYICDESHYLGNPKAARTDLLDDYIKEYKPKRVLFLSGSPITGKVPQWYAPIVMMGRNPLGTSGKVLKMSYMHFKNKFCEREEVYASGGRRVTRFFGSRNLPTLREFLVGKYIRKSDLFELDLPEFSYKEVEVDYEVDDKELKEAWEEYKKTQKETEAISSAKKNSAMSKVPFTAKYSIDIHKELGEPVVIYSDHIDPAKTLFETLSKKYKCCLIYGDTSIPKRDEYVTGFQNGKYDFFIATIGAASTGITLTKATNMVFNDRSWVYEYNQQAEKRIHRIGQKNECVFHLLYANKIDEMIDKTNEQKKDIGEQTTDWEHWMDL